MSLDYTRFVSRVHYLMTGEKMGWVNELDTFPMRVGFTVFYNGL